MSKRNLGVSLISLIITIIVIIILASISFFGGMKTPENALLANFDEEVNNVRTALATYRAGLFEEYGDMDYEAKAVEIIDAPSEFVSISDSSTKGYVVDMSKLNYSTTSIAKDAFEGDTVTFDVDDVIVYDKLGAVYYAKGYRDENKLYYNVKCYKVVEGE
jgi:type II secretory pathway pseudopilin PulG